MYCGSRLELREAPLRSLVLSTVFALALTTGAMAWGDRGHSIVAEIALHHLDEKLTAAVQKLLGNASLAGTASWADEYIRRRRRQENARSALRRHRYHASGLSALGLPGSGLPGIGIVPPGENPRGRHQARCRSQAGPAVRRPSCRRSDAAVSLRPAQPRPWRQSRQGRLRRHAADGKLRAIPETELHGVWDDSLVDNRTFAWGTYADELEKKMVPQITDVTLAQTSPWNGSTNAITSSRSFTLSCRSQTRRAISCSAPNIRRHRRKPWTGSWRPAGCGWLRSQCHSGWPVAATGLPDRSGHPEPAFRRYCSSISLFVACARRGEVRGGGFADQPRRGDHDAVSPANQQGVLYEGTPLQKQ